MQTVVILGDFIQDYMNYLQVQQEFHEASKRVVEIYTRQKTVCQRDMEMVHMLPYPAVAHEPYSLTSHSFEPFYSVTVKGSNEREICISLFY
jgi:hypothetical protein